MSQNSLKIFFGKVFFFQILAKVINRNWLFGYHFEWYNILIFFFFFFFFVCFFCWNMVVISVHIHGIEII